MKKLVVLFIASGLLFGMIFFAALNFEMSDIIVKKRTTLNLNYTQSHISNLIYNLTHQLDTNKYRLLSAEVSLQCDKNLNHKQSNQVLNHQKNTRHFIADKFQFHIAPSYANKNYLLHDNAEFGKELLSEIEKGSQENEEESSFIVSLYFKINISEDGSMHVKKIDNMLNSYSKKESLHNIQIKVANKFYTSNNNLALK